ncbi:DEAD/DEAH box helicase domain protein [Xylanimonas cellulosilytica DSM 15894]|uniref:DEAD/DEAH box helicase domain protein n=1 Tax=Xylanimonas cellulosilytica (strain DSM 15894 / JCM 12276 / CECT 5975 / KCTC 9989 / LMG 20990 / NBRC 107835 / XIL07) TaxID=446471 RepID=D1BUU0_XYLCX|nr:DEAD/DEAH box helicase [Xylanimonas cellulosilytica]ACZ29331.1 DEAD/DEAH box helicase domain protein [Xylanimonas cellulosilytica DSM 15894]
MNFTDLGLPMPVVASLAERGITSPFPIQAASLPDSLAGKDVLGRGRTGSGKTVAFALPVVTRLAGGRRAPRRPRALILAPTRELALQIDATTAPLAKVMGLRTTVVFGGVAQSRQVTALDAGVDILIACPGRLEDLLNQRLLTLDGIEITVLDEADHMADLGFLPGVKRLMDRTPTKGQRLLFSATLDNGVDVLVKRYLHQPVTHSVDEAAAPPPLMTHHVLAVADAAAKRDVVRQLAAGTGRRVLFMRTKHHAKKLAKQLTLDGVPAVDLHGNLGQGARERNLAAFTSGDVKVLVATDIAARGIHVDDIELVVHVDPPAEHKAYLHRSGRTARAGSGGDVVTIMLPEQRKDVADLTRKAKITAQPQPVVPGDRTVTALVGEAAAPVITPEIRQARARADATRTAQERARTGASGTSSSSRTAPSARAGRSGAASSTRAASPSGRASSGTTSSGSASSGPSSPGAPASSRTSTSSSSSRRGGRGRRPGNRSGDRAVARFGGAS